MSPNSTEASNDQQYWPLRTQLLAALIFLASGGGLVAIMAIFHR